MKVILICLVSFCVTIEGTAQKPSERIVVNEEGEPRVDFKSPDGTVVKTIKVLEQNRYAKLRYKPNSRGIFTIPTGETLTFLNYFFNDKNFDTSRIASLRYRVFSNAFPSERHVVIMCHAHLYGGENGILGVRSEATVFDESGHVVAQLPENNDGYFETAVTSDGAFMGVLYGDTPAETDYSLLVTPGFRIYDLRTKGIIVDIPSTNEYDALSPTSYEDVIVGVFSCPGKYYAYHFFNMKTRTKYVINLTTEQVGKMSKFTTEGIQMRDSSLLSFQSDFVRSTF